MYPLAFLLGLAVALASYGQLCDVQTDRCFRVVFQSIPMVIACLAALLLYGWKFVVVERLAKKSGKPADEIARNSKSLVRRLGLALILFALAWICGNLVRMATG